jgi:hypothetical protein
MRMQMLLWVHNHASADGDRGRLCGLAVGTSPQVQVLGPVRPLSSFAELRCDAERCDPLTELQLAVAKAFACAGAVAPGFHVEYRGIRSHLRLGLEPGFDSPHAVLEPLAGLLRGVRVHGGVLVSAGSPTALA